MSENDTSELRAAAETLVEVRDRIADDETAERLGTFADQLETMADADRGPDHGRLDRVMHSLREIADDLDGDEADAVEDARSQVRSYRETVEGV